MMPGDDTFRTGARESMEILSGELEVLPDEQEWRMVKGGEFKLRVKVLTDYRCDLEA